MFRITRLLQITKPLMNVSSCCFKSSPLLYSSRMCFSDKTANRIFQMIEQGDLEQNLGKIITDMTPLNKGQRQQVMDTLLQKIYDRELPPRVILDQKFGNQLKKYPVLHFQAYYFRAVQSINRLNEYIDGKDKKIKMVIAKEISDSFIACFQDLKKIQPKTAAPKQIQLLRSFAHYNFHYLSKLVDPTKRHQCINKSRQCFKLTLVKSTALLKTLTKEEKQISSRTNPHQTLQQKQEREDLLQEIEDTKFQVMEEYSEVVTEMLNIEEQLFAQKNQKQMQLKEEKQKEEQQKQDQTQAQEQIEFQMSKQTLWLQPAIEKAIKNYEKILPRVMESKYYYKLRKTHLDVKRQIRLREIVASTKNKEERKQLLVKLQQQTTANMDSLYKTALDELKKIESEGLEAEAFADHIMVMLSTKVERFIVDKGQEYQMDDKGLGDEVQNLVNYIADQDTKKKTLALLIKKVKQIYDVKIDKYVQKVPRNFRTQRRKRLSEDDYS